MTFFDTNILVYYTINQDDKKQKLSQSVIFEAIKEDNFYISSLVMTEYIFILSKLKVLDENHNKVLFFSKFIEHNISTDDLLDAYKICKVIDFCKNINDTIHFVIAQKYCDKLVSFDSDFKKLQDKSNIEIEILKI